MSKKLRITIATILTLLIIIAPYFIGEYVALETNFSGGDRVSNYLIGFLFMFLGGLVLSLFLVIGVFIYDMLPD